MASLPSFNTEDRILSMLQSQWSTLINPVLANPLVKGRLISGITLTTGTNVINHLLNRPLKGYFVVMNSASATFYDKQASNPSPSQTLQLVASAPAVISLWVF